MRLPDHLAPRRLKYDSTLIDRASWMSKSRYRGQIYGIQVRRGAGAGHPALPADQAELGLAGSPSRLAAKPVG